MRKSELRQIIREEIQRTQRLNEIKGRNNKTGESFGMVVGSNKKDEYGYELVIRVGYSSRISAYKFTFDNDSNLISVGDYGYTLDGRLPDMLGHSSVTRVSNQSKRETIATIADITSKAFASKIYKHVIENNV